MTQTRALVAGGLGLTALLLTAAVAADDAPLAALKANNCAPVGELRGNAERGAIIHLKNCAECHGPDGKAEVLVLHMDVPPKDQSDPAYMKTLPDAFLYLAVCKGGLGVGRNFIMPAWGDVLTDQDIRDLIAQMRTFSGT